MSRPRFLADHDLSDHLIEGVLRQEPSVTFIRARERGWECLPDDQLLEQAASESLAVVSHDVNTMSAAAYARIVNGQLMAGLLLVPQSASIADSIESLVIIWTVCEEDELVNQVRFLPFPRP
jgi:hypothetical protein